jgi:CDP-glucose 4,6-dehydratase
MVTMNTPGFGNVFRNKKVLITGHTGFKGSWLVLWLKNLGADVYGYSQAPPTSPSMFELLDLQRFVHNHTIADVRDDRRLSDAISQIRPDIIFHLAAQSLVGRSYAAPLETIQVNVQGTVNLLEAVREAKFPVAIIVVTSDKCYDNKEWLYGYRENDPLGGYDPYSASKGAAEILVNSWRNSFFNPKQLSDHGVRIATVRSGNVIGGGDWGTDRIFPDCIKDLLTHEFIRVRNPEATRPWQHVLEPLSGYLLLGSKLMDTNAAEYCEAFNFGPLLPSNRSVQELVEKIIEYWGEGSWKCVRPPGKNYHEASLLNLSIDKAYHKLHWQPKWNFNQTVQHTVEWYKMAQASPSSMLEFSEDQIRMYEESSMTAENTLVRDTQTII